MTNGPSPTERIQRFNAERAAEEERQAETRLKVLASVGVLAVKYTEGIKVVHEQETTSNGEPAKSHFHTYTFDYDESPSYRLTKLDNWSMGDTDQVTYTFDEQMTVPIRDINVGNLQRSPQANWYELETALTEMSSRLEEVDTNPKVFIPV